MLLTTFLCKCLLALIFILGVADAFYLPGVAPANYKKGDRIPLLVNHIAPTLHRKTKLHNNDVNAKTYIYSYDYYYPKFHYCRPNEGLKKQSESLGSIIFGDRIFNSPFEINMLEDKACVPLCESQYSAEDAEFVNRNIRAGYNHNWIIDGLPAAKVVASRDGDFYGSGFAIGGIDENGNPYFANHFDILVEYHKRAEDTYRVVGVIVDPKSIDQSSLTGMTCQSDAKKYLLDQGTTNVQFSYSVKFAASETPWATRWDKYLHVYDPKIQWISLIQFSAVTLVLSLLVILTLRNNLRKDIANYNDVNLDDNLSEESGWKLVHADVFRSPAHRMLMCVFIGSGTQVLLMSAVTIVFAMLGFLSPANRGALSTTMFILYIFFGFPGSFVSAYLYRFFHGENWKLNMILTPTLIPGSLFSVFILLNFFLVYVRSSGAVPVGTMFAMIAIWFLISLPLSIAGTIFAYKKPSLNVPVKTNQIPRQIPKQPWYLKTIPNMLFSGIFPFGAIAVEMYLIYSSLWFNRLYYMFGFLFYCFVLMIVTTGILSATSIYQALCSENYKWQWKSINVGGSCAIYVFINSLLLLKNYKLTGMTSIVLYVGYSFVISFFVFLCCGTIGFFTCFYFVRKIYSHIKLD